MNVSRSNNFDSTWGEVCDARSHQRFMYVCNPVRSLGVMLRIRCWPTAFHATASVMVMDDAGSGWCDQPLSELNVVIVSYKLDDRE